jgi:MFS family permease
MARIGASAFQLGMFSASPAIITLLFALPTGWWLKNRSLDRSVFWSAALIRIFYLFWILLPILFTAKVQIWLFVGFTLLMSIPGTMLAISFNALFADAVPPEWRAHVSGVRNALLAMTFILTSLLCGYLLSWFPFPLGYQVVFGVGFLGAGLSTLHLWFIRIESRTTPRPQVSRTLGDQARPGSMRLLGNSVRISVGLRSFTRSRQLRLPRLSMLRSSFGKIILVMFLFHLGLYLPGPLYPFTGSTAST